MEKGHIAMIACHTCGLQQYSVVCFSSCNNYDVINVCHECYVILKLRFGWIYLTYGIVRHMIDVKTKICPWNGVLISV